MSFYLDASAILPVLIAEAASAAVDAFIASVGGGLVISDFAAAEVASALSRLVRMGRLELADALIRLADFDAWRVQATTAPDLASADIRLADIFVRRFDLALRAPDALHAAICRRNDLVLVTLDRRLARAAGEFGVAVSMPAG